MEPLSKTVYKYLPRAFAELLVQNGQIKIGTLFSYRQDEIEARKDEDEATKTIFTEQIEFGADDIPETLKRDKVIEIEGNGKVVFSNYTIGYPNAYIYCVSQVLSREVMDSFSDCDTVVEISNWEFVFENLATSFAVDGRIQQQYMYAECDYSGRKFKGDSSANPFILKDPKYAYQKEIRLVMIPTQKEISSFVVEIPELTKYVRIIELP